MPARRTSRRKRATTSARRKTKKGAARKTGGRKTTARKTGGKATRGRTTSRSGAAKSRPARRPRLTSRSRLAAVLERLDRAFGTITLPDTRDTLEKAVYLIVREQGSATGNARALKALREDFVDWNEVRVSRPTELCRLMCGSSKVAPMRRFEVRSRRIREMIDQIYNDKNEPSLEFLLDDRAKGQLEYLEDLDDLGIHNAYALVQWLSGDDRLALVSSEMARAAQRCGLTDSAAVTKVRKELTKLAGPEQLVTLQAHLNQLGNLEADEWPGAVKEFIVS